MTAFPGNERRRADGRHRGMKKKRKLPGKFYLAAAAGILLVAAVIAWNSSGEKKETEIQQQAATVMSGESAEAATDSLKKTESEKEPAGLGAGSDGGENLEGWDVSERASGPGAGLDFDEYYWGGKRYTEISVGYLTEDMEWRDFVDLKNSESMQETLGADYGGVAILLESYLEQHGLEADTATVLLDRYAGTSYGREEYYIQFEDKEETLVTFLYHPPQGGHGAYLDVLPCQYTLKEVKDLLSVK